MAKRRQKAFSSRFSLNKLFSLCLVGIAAFAITTVTSHTSTPTCANSKSCTSDLSVKIEDNQVGMFQGRVVVPPKISAITDIGKSQVLGISTGNGEKHVYIDLSKQTLYAYQGTSQVFKTLISSGKWGRTPTGNFNIWEKLIATRMTGGEGADAYDLPNVPYVMYFFHDFGLHGAYWHNNFGHPMSHGCINMRPIDAKTLFDWADGPSGNKLGTPVSVCDQISDSGKCIQDNPIN